MRKMNIVLTAAVVIICGLVLWFGVTAIVKIWQQSVEIGEFVDDKDGSQGKRAQAIIDFILREAPDIHRRADLSAISVGTKLEVPMVGRRDPGLERIESLDIKVKDVQLNWVFAILRALAKPSCEVNGRVKLGQASTDIAVEMTDSSIRATPIIVSVPHTADANNDTEQAATAAGYELLHALYQHFATDKSRVPGSSMSLERFTEGLRSLQEYRLAARSGDAGDVKVAQDHLTTAIAKLEQVRQIDPGYNDGLYYLGVAYFERRRMEEAKDVFNDLLKREPPQSLEAQFYLGYAEFRLYTETSMTNALTEYGKLQAKLESQLQEAPPSEENKRTLGLLAETYSQIATTHAHLLFIQKRDSPADQEESVKHSALSHSEATKDYANKANLLSKANANLISAEILADVNWRRLNALGIAEFSFTRFDNRSEYDEHCKKALDYFEQALRSSPLNANVLENEGEVYRDQMYCEYDLEEAKKLYLLAAGLEPKDYYPLQQLAMIYESLGQEWLKRSNEEKVKGNLDKAEENNEKAKENENKMIEYFQKAAGLDSSLAKARLDKLHGGAKATPTTTTSTTSIYW